MQDTHIELADQLLGEITSAPEGTSLKLMFQRLDGAGDKLAGANHEDHACVARQQAAA